MPFHFSKYVESFLVTDQYYIVKIDESFWCFSDNDFVSTSVRITLAPYSKSASACFGPNSHPAPVTKATLPSKSNKFLIIVFLFYCMCFLCSLFHHHQHLLRIVR